MGSPRSSFLPRCWEKSTGFCSPICSQGRPLQLGALEGELEEREITLLAEILGRPAALENGAAAMADYRAVIETEQMKRENDTDEAVLLAARDNYRKKKSI